MADGQPQKCVILSEFRHFSSQTVQFSGKSLGFLNLENLIFLRLSYLHPSDKGKGTQTPGMSRAPLKPRGSSGYHHEQGRHVVQESRLAGNSPTKIASPSRETCRRTCTVSAANPGSACHIKAPASKQVVRRVEKRERTWADGASGMEDQMRQKRARRQLRGRWRRRCDGYPLSALSHLSNNSTSLLWPKKAT